MLPERLYLHSQFCVLLTFTMNHCCLRFHKWDFCCIRNDPVRRDQMRYWFCASLSYGHNSVRNAFVLGSC